MFNLQEPRRPVKMLCLMFKFSPYVLCMEILPIGKWMEPQSYCLEFGVQRLF